MKILILYTSLGGTTKEAADRITSGFAVGDVTVRDLKKGTVSVTGYDAVVVLAPIYFGKLEKQARIFLSQKEEELLQTRLYLGYCCGLTDESEDYADSVFPRKLREHAESVLYLGGSLQANGRSFFHRLILWKMRSAIRESEMEAGEYTPVMPGFLPENADRIVSLIKARK